jgi:hypothetical protein
MFKYLFVGTALASALLAASPSLAFPPATCIGKHCAVIAAGPVVVAAHGIAAFVNPGPGIYCLLPAGAPPPAPYVPVVSVSDDLSPNLPVAVFGVSFAEVAMAARACPARFVEIDAFAPAGPTFGAPLVAQAPVPSNAVGVVTQF